MMATETRMRLGWVQLYEETNDAGYVCRRSGISRPTLRKWLKRYQEEGLTGLKNQSKRPKHSPNQKIFEKQEEWILEIRSEMNIGARRIQNELVRQYDYRLSLASIQKILQRNQVKPVQKPQRRKKLKRYQKAIPGERVQMDTCKIRPGMYQFTAVDDCTRYLVVEIYPRRTANNTLLFLDKVAEEMPFPIQRIQTDRGTEFMAYKVQERLMEWRIKFRPNRPGAPHLNGKVERAQKTVLGEFYALVDLDDVELSLRLSEWQHFYNWFRKHGSIGTTPMEKLGQLYPKTPYLDEIAEFFDPDKEYLRAFSYLDDLALQKLKRSL
jgi:transposase InsO family protein